MNDQKEKEKTPGENKDMKKKKGKLSGEKRFYLLTAIGCALALVAVITVAIAASVNKVEQGNMHEQPSVQAPSDSNNSVDSGDNQNKDDEQVVVTPEGMISPLETVTMLNEHGFYHNKTLNSYYEHKGVDFSAQVGDKVLAVEKGVVESIFTGDILTGTEIVVKHEDGLKSIYRFVDQAENLKVGDTVEKGQVLATVAEANGNEYKDGAHLHFEIIKDGASVDPSAYLTLEEK